LINFLIEENESKRHRLQQFLYATYALLASFFSTRKATLKFFFFASQYVVMRGIYTENRRKNSDI